MKADFQNHLKGVFKILKNRFDYINQSIGHNLTTGEGNEKEIRKLLIDFLPENYGIGSGIIVDTEGNQSKQVDIVIYDKNTTNYTLSKDSKIYLVDQVLACIEVKTSFTSGAKGSLNGALKNVESIKKLKPSIKTWVEPQSTWIEEDEQSYSLSIFSSKPPLCIIFFYKSSLPKISCDIDSVKEQFNEQISQFEVKHHPELIFSLDHSLMFRYEDISKTNGEGKFHTCFKRMSDSSKDLTLNNVDKKIGGVFCYGELDLSENSKITSSMIFNNESNEAYIALLGNGMSSDSTFFKTAFKDDNLYLLDPFRGFMLFLTSIEMLLSHKKTNKNSFITDYFPKGYFSLFNI